jgi:regulator of protease activity HflC (stomatin/prohibitin superfamily)
METNSPSIEKPRGAWNGFLSLILLCLLLAVCALIAIRFPPFIAVGLLLFVVWAKGFLILAPNEAAVLTFFGPYVGTLRMSGFFWVNPLLSHRKISLRAHNLEGGRLKVNDKRGNPIEIGAIVVWRVSNTAAALFDVENFEEFVRIQSESAVRHLASSYPYDHGEEKEEAEITLRDSTDVVCTALQNELQARFKVAGIEVSEARISHLAYAPEIAGAMLRRQQAEAVIAARQKIVHGAVSMVQMALNEITRSGIVELSADKRADMVNNLLVVLCGETEAQPVLKAGS